MRFVIQTTYDFKAMTAMARTLRKTIRKKSSARTHIFGTIIVIIAVLLLISSGWPFGFSEWITLISALAIVIVTATEDQLNCWLAQRKVLPGSETGETVFSEEGYITTTTAAETHWKHEQVKAVYEAKDYFVFFLSDRHGQVYDKSGFKEGTIDEFRRFLSEKTGKPVEYIK